MRRLLCLVALALASSALAGGVTGRGGFDAVAASADGKYVAVGGQNRVVYVLDAATLAVVERHAVGARVGNLALLDGGLLLVEDETDTLRLIDRKTSRVVGKRANARHFLLRPASSEILAFDESDFLRPKLLRLSSSDLGEAAVVELPDRVASAWADPSGKSLVVLNTSKPAERPVVPVRETPADLRGLARAVFRMKHDGYDADVVDIDLATGKPTARRATWYTSDSDSTVVTRRDGVTRVYNRVNLCGRIDAKGAAEVFETDERVNHGIGVSPSGEWLLTGTMGGGTHGKADGARTRFELPPRTGQDEWVVRFAVADDGSAWGVTTAYRLIRIGATGKAERVVDVY